MRFMPLAPASAMLLALLNIGVSAQTNSGEGPPAGQIQHISKAEFDQMVQAGQLLPVTKAGLAAAQSQRHAAYLRNKAIVDDYLSQNPNETRLAKLVAATPDPSNPNVVKTADGNYNLTFVNTRGVTQTVETMGEQFKMALLASSVQAASNPAVQLQNYTDLYNRLPANFINGVGPANGPAITRPIPPAELQGASLTTIQHALATVLTQWQTIISMLPPYITGVQMDACNAEAGASFTANETSYGDEVPTPRCTPSPGGLFFNVSFVNQGLLTCIKDQGNRGTCGEFAATLAVEELIAIEAGVHVNLSEQDFIERLLLSEGLAGLYNDAFDPAQAVTWAMINDYQFAYENQWDYNPAFDQPTCSKCYEYVNTCIGYPSSEPGCSATAPEAAEYCSPNECGFAPAVLPGHSPYSRKSVIHGVSYLRLWGSSSMTSATAEDLTVDYMILSLALNGPVMMFFIGLCAGIRQPARKGSFLRIGYLASLRG